MLRDDPNAAGAALLAWYDRHHRDLPWRVPPDRIAWGERPDPYRVWLSEIMLQQTTVAAVKPYFAKFVALWPTVGALAGAEPDDVMKAWAGLGYYSRARNLKACADAVMRDHGGVFPDTEDGLRALPGIGAYTAAAIAAIAFARAAVVVDGNVERVVARLNAIDVPVAEAKPAIRATVASMLMQDRPGDFAQSMMDLGATICTPKTPACILCPVSEWCEAFHQGDPALYPVKAAKAAKPLRRGAAFIAVRPDGSVLLRKRADKGLLAGMAEPPGTPWTARLDGSVLTTDAPFPAKWQPAGSIHHVFTHFELDLTVFRADGGFDTPAGWWWSRDLDAEALPTVMKKAIAAALSPALPRNIR